MVHCQLHVEFNLSVMKEQESVKIDNVQEVRPAIKKQLVVTKSRPIPGGHKIFEYNKVLQQLRIAEKLNKPQTFQVKPNGTGNKIHHHVSSVKMLPNCHYFTALNKKNARKKMEKKFNPDFIIVLD